MLGEVKRRAHEESLLGRRFPVLLEGSVEDGLRFGWTEHYVRVGIPEPGTRENTIVEVGLLRIEDGYCAGELRRQEAAA
jgi:hypothetical protein